MIWIRQLRSGRLVARRRLARDNVDLECDVLIVGAGCGGVAAARSAAVLGCQVVLADRSGWLGGQLTAQAVPPDEHPWVERTGITASYRRMREAVRDSYRADPRLREQVRRRVHLNPGGGWVSRLCAEPGVIHGVLDELLDPYRAAGNLRLLQHYRPVRAEVDADLIRVVEFTGSRGARARGRECSPGHRCHRGGRSAAADRL
jgi:NADPH-dependent 2,4-dienoyl-CoA reductase/sulfur reductase-like enzyme